MKDNKKEVIASVIITAKNEKQNLKQSLPVLMKQKMAENYEVILIDSGSTDGSIKFIKKIHIKLIRIKPEEFNYSYAFNKCAAQAKGKYLIKLSGDVIPIGNQWLNEMIKPFSDPTVGGTFGLYTTTGRRGYDYPHWWPKERFPTKLTTYSQTPHPLTGIKIFGVELTLKNTDKVHEFAGGCCAIRRGMWKKRPLNENLTAGEDAEYAWFLHLIGYDIVFNPKAKTIHEHKIEKIKKNAFRDKFGLSLWQFKYSWNIARYWLLRAVGMDPYKNLKLK